MTPCFTITKHPEYGWETRFQSPTADLALRKCPSLWDAFLECANVASARCGTRAGHVDDCKRGWTVHIEARGGAA